MTDVNQVVNQQERAKAYARAHRRIACIGWGLTAVYLALWIATGAAATLEQALAARDVSAWITVAAAGAALALPFEVLTFPLTIYGGFTLAHRFGQSRQTFGQWMADVAKGAAVGGALGLCLLEGLYAILRWQPAHWWLWAAAGVLLVNILLTHLGPVLIFPLFFHFAPLEDADLRDRLVRLCARARTQVRGVFTFDLGRKTRAANAALAGLGNTRRILLSDTLCAGYTPAEVEVVLAHELGHHVHHHLWKGMGASAASTLVVFLLVDWILGLWLPALDVASVAHVGGLPVLVLVFGVLSLLQMPIGNGLSRHFERQADAAALRLAGSPGAMITTMEKLADHNLADRAPHPFLVWWFHSHPPINQRIAAATAHLAATSAPGAETSV